MTGDLEFELEYLAKEEKAILYKVLRKGLRVGTLILDEEPYSYKIAQRKLMTLHNNFKENKEKYDFKFTNALESVETVECGICHGKGKINEFKNGYLNSIDCEMCNGCGRIIKHVK